MKSHDLDRIRNVALTGHAGSGKTTLAEALLFRAGAVERVGAVESGTTVCDYDPEEIRRKSSLQTALAPLEWKDCKINLADTPGLFDFEGEMLEGLSCAETALIVVSGKSGVNVGTEKVWKLAARRGMSRAFFVGKLDDETADFAKVLEALKDAFGASVCPVVVPAPRSSGDAYLCLTDDTLCRCRGTESSAEPYTPQAEDKEWFEGLKSALGEAVAQTDDGLLDKYFSGKPFSSDELRTGLRAGILSGSICPVFSGSALRGAGIDLLLDGIEALFPEAGPDALPAAESECTAGTGETRAFIFKTVADPYVGKLSLVRVLSGTLSAESQLINSRTGQPEKIGKLYLQRGKKQTDVTALTAGDIGAAAKLAALTGDVLSASADTPSRNIPFPEPCLTLAVSPKNKGDDDKISQGLHRLSEEDPTLRFETNAETHQLLISGLGEQHLDYIVSKLKTKFGIEVETSKPAVAFRETIRRKVRAEGKHKKQTGGHGQYGDVVIEFEPCDEEGLVFVEKVIGGAVPKNYFPAVEKGLRECMQQGVLAGYPVVHLKATLVDGSYHPVDSSEASFKAAAALAFRTGLPQAEPVLLEPICQITALVPDASMGDVIGEINRRRGRMIGMEPTEDGYQHLEAEAPVTEAQDFSTVLRSVTQGRGTCTFRFVRYEEAPPQVLRDIVPKNRAAG